MNSTKNSGFFAKCPFCAEEYYNCRESFRNQNVVCTKCYKTFPLIEFQNDTNSHELKS
jgi:formylmethanofuran dehydrogenase subunit E